MHSDTQELGLGSLEYTELMETQRTYAILSGAISTGLGAGASGVVFSGSIGRKVFLEALKGTVEGVGVGAADGRIVDRGFNEDLLSVTGQDPNSYSVITGLAMSGVMGGVMGGGVTGVMDGGSTLIGQRLKLHFNFNQPEAPQIILPDGTVSSAKVIDVTDEGRVIIELAEGERYSFYPEDVPEVVRRQSAEPEIPRAAAETREVVPIRNSSVGESFASQMLDAHSDLRSDVIPDDVLERAIRLSQENPDAEIHIQRYGRENDGVTDYDYNVLIGSEAHAPSTALGDSEYNPIEADFFQHEFVAHIHRGEISLDERVVATEGQEFDDDLVLFLARVRSNARYNAEHSGEAGFDPLPTRLTHEVFGMGDDGQLAKLQFTVGLDSTGAVEIEVKGVNMDPEVVGFIQSRTVDLNRTISEVPEDQLSGVAGQMAASRYDDDALRAEMAKPKPETLNMPDNLTEHLGRLEIGDSIVLGRDLYSYGIDLQQGTVSRQHLRLGRSPEGFYVEDLSGSLTVVTRDSEHRRFELFSSHSRSEERGGMNEIRYGRALRHHGTTRIALEDGDVIQMGWDQVASPSFVFESPSTTAVLGDSELVVFEDQVFMGRLMRRPEGDQVFLTPRGLTLNPGDELPIEVGIRIVDVDQVRPLRAASFPEQVTNESVAPFYSTGQEVAMINFAGEPVTGSWKVGAVLEETGEISVINESGGHVRFPVRELHDIQTAQLRDHFSLSQWVSARGHDGKALPGRWRISRIDRDLGFAMITDGERRQAVGFSQLYSWEKTPLPMPDSFSASLADLSQKPESSVESRLLLGHSQGDIPGMHMGDPSLKAVHGAIFFDRGQYTIRAGAGEQVVVGRGEDRFVVSGDSRLGVSNLLLQEGDLIHLGEMSPPIRFEKPFQFSSELANSRVSLKHWKPVQDETTLNAWFKEATDMLRPRAYGKSFILQIPVAMDASSAHISQMEQLASQMMTFYKSVDGFQFVSVKSDVTPLPSPDETKIISQHRFYSRQEVMADQQGVNWRPLLQRAESAKRAYRLEPEHFEKKAGNVTLGVIQGARTRYVSPGDMGTTSRRMVHRYAGYQAGEAVIVLRDRGGRERSYRIPQSGWKIVSFDPQKGTAIVERPDPRFMGSGRVPIGRGGDGRRPGIIEGALQFLGFGPKRSIPVMQKEVPLAHIMTQRELEASEGMEIDPAFEFLRRRQNIDEHAHLSPTQFNEYFHGNFRQANVGNCYLVAVLRSLSNNPDNFQAMMRLAIQPVPGGWNVRVPLGQVGGEVIFISQNDLKPQDNSQYVGQPRVHQPSKIERRRQLNPIEGPQGYQILEAVYTRLLTASPGETFGPMDRLAIDGGGYSPQAVKMLLGDAVHIDRIPMTGLGASRSRIDDYLLHFDPAKDIGTLSSLSRKGYDHDKSYRIDGIKFAYNHAYSIDSVVLSRAGSEGSDPVIEAVRVVNPWDNSKTIRVPIETFYKAFFGINVGEIDMSALFRGIE